MLSFILIEYHSLDDVKKFNQNRISENSEIIVSSNSQYSIGKKEELIAQFPFLTWVFNERNGGRLSENSDIAI